MASLADPTQQIYLKCLSDNSSTPIDQVIYFPTTKLYTSILKSNIRNLIFASDSTPRPLFIVAPTHLSHIQSTILCCKTHSLQLRIRSGGHDYEGLSYTSSSPFALLDLHNYNSVVVDLDSETAWVDSCATLGEVYHQFAAKSRTHEFPGGVCPTVGVGGFLSGAGYGNLMRKYGLSDDELDIGIGGGALIRDSFYFNFGFKFYFRFEFWVWFRV
ncbi:Tetrahydroberberine oxidase [Linum grandiflorum]